MSNLCVAILVFGWVALGIAAVATAMVCSSLGDSHSPED